MYVACVLGNTVSICVDVEKMGVAFLLNSSFVHVADVYEMKSVLRGG